MASPGSFKHTFYKSLNKDSSHLFNIVVSRTSVARTYIPALAYIAFGVCSLFFPQSLRMNACSSFLNDFDGLI